MSSWTSRRATGIVCTIVAGIVALTGSVSAEPAQARRTRTPAHMTPETGVRFNNPVGTVKQQYRLINYVNRAIDSAPPRSVIRIAVFSMSEGSTADKLIAAYRRGVKVRLVFNEDQLFPAQQRLIRVLGTNTSARSFVKVCDESCRGWGHGNMHDKIFLFSKVGEATQVVMAGSNNITRFNARNQWADVFTLVGNTTVYSTFVSVFGQLRRDRTVEPSYLTRQVGQYHAHFFPYRGVTRATDPLFQILDPVRCYPGEVYPPADPEAEPVTPPAGTPRTVVHVSMHAWHSSRGVELAHTMADLHRRGCAVAVILGEGAGARVRNILETAGIPVFYGTKKNSRGRIRTHQKVLTIGGVHGSNNNARIVVTGSHNWSVDSLRHDDVVLRIDDPVIYDRYAWNFRKIQLLG